MYPPLACVGGVPDYKIPGTKAHSEYWLSAFGKYKKHRDECRVCCGENPLVGQICATGKVLRNAAIDEGDAP